ncbi:2,5-diketo-D-gluconate reductase, partial [human gut metagenome]
KVAAEHKTYESAAKSIDETLSKMGLDYLDMMIIHSPQPWVVSYKLHAKALFCLLLLWY